MCISRTLNPYSDVHSYQLNYFLIGIMMPSFGPGEGPIFFHQLRCTGSENRLSDCSKSSSYSLNHYNDAGVRCQLNFSPGKVILQCHSLFTNPSGGLNLVFYVNHT